MSTIYYIFSEEGGGARYGIKRRLKCGIHSVHATMLKFSSIFRLFLCLLSYTNMNF